MPINASGFEYSWRADGPAIDNIEPSDDSLPVDVAQGVGGDGVDDEDINEEVDIMCKVDTRYVDYVIRGKNGCRILFMKLNKVVEFENEQHLLV